jgi:short-subunit dehydrogenase
MTVSSSTRALITGASAGIGEGFARHLAQRGSALVLVARRRERLELLASELDAQLGTTAEVLQADLATDDGVQAVAARIAADDIDLLVNNAGFGTVGEFTQLKLERELQQIDLNVRAIVGLTHAALGRMAPRGSGSIINVASAAAFQPIPYNATYAATKAFVLHFSEAVHEEARRHGVSVTCVCPGPVQTEFQEVAGIHQSVVPQFGWESVDSVVRAALGAVADGRAIVTPGRLNTLTSNATRLAPRILTRRIAGSVFRRAGSD